MSDFEMAFYKIVTGRWNKTSKLKQVMIIQYYSFALKCFFCAHMLDLNLLPGSFMSYSPAMILSNPLSDNQSIGQGTEMHNCCNRGMALWFVLHGQEIYCGWQYVYEQKLPVAKPIWEILDIWLEPKHGLKNNSKLFCITKVIYDLNQRNNSLQ